MAYTSIDDPSAYFQAKTYSGNGTDDTAITNDGNSNLQPDLWIVKRRAGGAAGHGVFDSTRGVTKRLNTNLTNAEDTVTDRIKSFDTNGFTLGDNEQSNASGSTYVAWQWKANGGTTSSNTDGYLTSTVQANTTADFSIVTFTTDGNTRTVGHGLGAKPDVIWIASRNVAGGFLVITDAIDGSMDYGTLRNTNAFASISYNAPTSTVFEYNDNNTNTQVAYCFAEKQGYSKFGKYTGNGNANGTFVYTGFKPAFVMTKASSSTSSWMMYDHKRLGYNPIDVALRANGTDTESTSLISGDDIDLYSNGFKLRNSNGTINGSSITYFYMAFAENPFVTSTGTPTTAR
jgi:hypothetical protein